MADFNAAANAASELLELRLIGELEKTALSLNQLVGRLQTQGITREQIRIALLRDFEADGPIFGPLRRNIERLTSGSVGEAETRASREVFRDEFGEDFRETWIALLRNTCRDCVPRHGKTETSEFWDFAGRPPQWGSICDPNCKCRLVPAVTAEGKRELMEPLKLAKKKALRSGDKEPDQIQLPRTLKQRRFVRKLGQANKPTNQEGV